MRTKTATSVQIGGNFSARFLHGDEHPLASAVKFRRWLGCRLDGFCPRICRVADLASDSGHGGLGAGGVSAAAAGRNAAFSVIAS
jgi:hypothetical protein